MDQSSTTDYWTSDRCPYLIKDKWDNYSNDYELELFHYKVLSFFIDLY